MMQILCISYANNPRMVWIKRDSGGGYFFSPKITDQDGNGKLAEIESGTVILEKGSLSMIF
jgi:hypothetical protein